MNIRPSAAIRQNYNEIADMCRKTAEPVFLTKNGEGDLVVMDIETPYDCIGTGNADARFPRRISGTGQPRSGRTAHDRV